MKAALKRSSLEGEAWEEMESFEEGEGEGEEGLGVETVREGVEGEEGEELEGKGATGVEAGEGEEGDFLTRVGEEGAGSETTSFRLEVERWGGSVGVDGVPL